MGGTAPGRGHGQRRNMHSPRGAAKIALPDDIARERMQQQQMAEQQHNMVIGVRTQAAVEIMANIMGQAINANIHSPDTAPLNVCGSGAAELDRDRLHTIAYRAAQVATIGADALVEEMYGIRIQRQPVPTENEEGEEEGDASEADTDVEEPVKPSIITED